MKRLYKILFVFMSLWLSNCIDDPVMNTQLQNGIAPEVSETSLVTKGASTMTLKAHIIKENGSQIKECGICWSHMSENLPQTNIYQKRYKKSSIIENKEFQVSLTDLDDDTDYYVYAYAINESDTAYSSVGVYKTVLGVGEVYTCPIDSLHIKATSVIVSGKIKDRGEGIEQLGFYLSEDNNKPSDKDSMILYKGDNIQEIDSFSCQITNIKPSTKYYVRSFATNPYGEFSFNVDSFTTTDGKPRLGILSLDSVNFTFADFSAWLKSEGDSSLTAFGFCWGTMDEPTIEEADTIQCSDMVENKFSGRITSLEPNKKYVVKAYATNIFGTVYSDKESFYPKSQLPSVTMYPIHEDSVQNGSAVIIGMLQNEGMSPVRSIGFCWSTTNNNPTILGQDCSFEDIELDKLEDKKYTYTLTNLKGGTTYYVNTYAVNGSGTQYSDVQSFTTPPVLVDKQIYQGTRRVYSAGFSVNEQAFIVGGDLGSERTNEVYEYNLDLDEWSLSAPYAEAYSQMATSVSNGSAFVMGGTDNSLYATECQQYISSSNIWIPLVSLPEGKGRYDAISFVYKDFLYLLGGITRAGYSRELWKYTGDEWKMMNENFPVNQQRGIVLVANDTVYAGLGNNAGLRKGFWMSTDSLIVWEDVPGTLPYNIGNISAAVHYTNEQWNSFFMIDNNGKIWEYNLSDKEWIEHQTTLKRMNNYHMFILKGKIYILGQDRFESNFFMMYDPVWDPRKK
ncbi:MAG: hypothetical protein E7085_07730 [Parabacteroides distasonis]|nr:hypothetical protein [Parabacteroides distasonis]